MVRKRIKIFAGLVIFFAVVAFALPFTYKEKNEIKYILKSESYAYLPLEAKNYIEKVYEETNEVILTEKNKVVNKPYLNPEYVNYLALTVEEQRTFDVIPDELILDYSYIDAASLLNEDEIPSKFDLRNVNGKNFVTPIKDQDSLGLCWAFATNAQAESLLLVQKDQSYTNSAQIFSERQLDYALASDGITDSLPLYSYNRILGEGGTFKWATTVMVDSLGLVDQSWSEYNPDDFESKEKNVVYNFGNSLYEVNETVIYPNLELSELNENNNDDQLIRKNYLNNLKSLIMQYGGSYVATADPTSRCSVSINGSRFMYDDGICVSASHAMQVIGWDDDYEYNICTGTKDSSNYYHINTNVSNCENGKVINGKGAWILKNSWGNSHQYVYIAYDSKNMEFNLIKELGQRDWDNYYGLNTGLYDSGSRTVIRTYNKQSEYQEKLKKIKFSALSQDAVYDIYVATDSNKSYQLYSTITSDFPGLYTVDLSDKDIYLNDKNFYVKIVTKDAMVSGGINVYTDNVEKIYQMKTNDATYENSLTDINKYIVRIASETVSIPENAIIDYKILNESREEITTNYVYTENTVFANKVFSKIIIDNDLPRGNYIVQSIYEGNVLDESNLVIDKDIVTIDGKGTEEEPYIITTPAQLDLIRKDAYAFYELGNDIDLTYDTTNENGLFYNDGKGWDPIKYSNIRETTDGLYSSFGFSGGFNGNNYKIVGLNINRPDESGIGLFANTYNLNYSNLYIKNLTLEKPNIVGKNYVGGVVGYINGTTYERMLNISNIVVDDGKISGNHYVGGVVGLLRAGSYLTNFYVGGERHLIDSLYNSATIEANDYAGGIFGNVTNIIGYKEGNSVFKISNVLNKGNVISKNSAGGIAGNIRTRENNDITIYNSMNTGKVSGANCSGGITCQLSEDSVGNLNLSNIYYIDDMGINLSNSSIVIDNVEQKNRSQLMDINSYSSWKNFTDYWKIEVINDAERMPVLKFMKFNYTDVAEVSVKLGAEVSLYNYIKPNIKAAANVDFEIADQQIVSISNEGIIKANSLGATTLHLISYYDGYEGDIVINVIKPKIIYYSNFGENSFVVQDVEDSNFSLRENEFVRSGYTFKEWNSNRDGSGTSYVNGQEVNITSSIDLYAQWIPNEYSIIYDANGGTGGMENDIFTYDKEQALSPNEFINEDLVFIGWNTKADGTGESYLDKEIVKNLVTEDSITLYAQWEELYGFVVNDYVKDKTNNYIDKVELLTDLDSYKSKFKLDDSYDIEIDLGDKEYIFTGSKTKIYKDGQLVVEFTNVIRGEVDGDGKIGYADYVNVYNHIYKTKHPDSVKKLLVNEYALAADMSDDGKVGYADYVWIYNKIKELKNKTN